MTNRGPQPVRRNPYKRREPRHTPRPTLSAHNYPRQHSIAVTPDRQSYHQTNPFRTRQTLRIKQQPLVDPLDDITDFEDTALIDAIMSAANHAAKRLAACKGFLKHAPTTPSIHAIYITKIVNAVNWAQPAETLYNELEQNIHAQVTAGNATPELQRLFCSHLADYLAAEPTAKAPPPPPQNQTGAPTGTKPPHNVNATASAPTGGVPPPPTAAQNQQTPMSPAAKKQKADPSASVPPPTPQTKPSTHSTDLADLQPAPRSNTNPINSAADFKAAYDRYFDPAATFTPRFFTDPCHPALRCIAMAAWCLQGLPTDVNTIYASGTSHPFVYDRAIAPTRTPLDASYQGYTLHTLPDTLTLGHYLNPVHYHWKKQLSDDMASRLLNPIILELVALSDGNTVTIGYHHTFCMVFKPAHLLYVGRRPSVEITQLTPPNAAGGTVKTTLDPAFHMGDVLEWQMSFPPGNQHHKHICKKLGSKLFPVWTCNQPTQTERRNGLKILAAYEIRHPAPTLQSGSGSFATTPSSSTTGSTI